MTNLSISNYVGGKRSNGFQCPNVTSDRITIASLLGGVPAAQGGTPGSMRIDASMDGGIEDDLLAAIYRFQTEQKKKNGLQMVDGYIKPGGETMRFLNRYCVQPVPPAESHRRVTKTDTFKISALVEIEWIWENPGNPRYIPGVSDRFLSGTLTLNLVDESGQSGISLLGPATAIPTMGVKKLDRPVILMIDPDFSSSDRAGQTGYTKFSRPMELSDFASRHYTIKVQVSETPVSRQIYVQLKIADITVVRRTSIDEPDLRDNRAKNRLVSIQYERIEPLSLLTEGHTNSFEWQGKLKKVSEF